MIHTLVAIFDNETHAQNALNELISVGFSRTDIHIKQSRQRGMAGASPSSAGDNSLAGRIESFFEDLFGHVNSDLYTDAEKRGNPLLVVRARDDDQLMRALDLLNRHNPIDVRECSSQWEGLAQSADVPVSASTSGSSQAASTQSTTDASATAARTPEESPATQTPHHASGQEMAALTGMAEPGMVPASDLEFRNHWQTSYAHQGGRYEDYAPAYQYGSTLGADERYKNRSWDEIEPQIRTDWEAKHAGSPWEKSKDAVRAAWERVMK